MNKFIRFFQPILKEPQYFYKFCIKEIIILSYTVYNIFFIQYLVKILESKQGDIWKSIYLYAGVSIIYFVIAYFTRYWGGPESTYHIFKMIHRPYFEKFNNLENTYIENIGTGKSISVLVKGGSMWSDLTITSIQILLKLIVFLGLMIFFVSQLGIWYVMSFLGIFIFLNIIAYFLNKLVLDYRKQRVEMSNCYDKQMTKMIMSKFEILQNNKIHNEIKVLDDYADKATDANLKLTDFLIGMFLLPDVFIFFVILGIFSFLSFGNIEYSLMISLFMLIGILRQTMNSSILFFKDFTKNFAVVEKMWEFFDEGKEISGLSTGKNFEYQHGNISLKNISFSYGKHEIFSDFSVEFQGGKKIAFVGTSGSGKTTLVKLLSGFLEAQKGEILIDNQNIKEINLLSYYKNIGYLTQDPSVFDGSIRENLLYGVGKDEAINESQLQEAIQDAHCEFIYEFEEGLETQIGERGVRLSGGQKQRLAIAKLFIKNPEIIILDEPTSALDSVSEELIGKSFEKLFAGKTVFVIAHRLQTVKNADEIFVFEQGKILERGNHEELLLKNGYYKRMLDLQSGF